MQINHVYLYHHTVCTQTTALPVGWGKSLHVCKDVYKICTCAKILHVLLCCAVESQRASAPNCSSFSHYIPNADRKETRLNIGVIL